MVFKADVVDERTTGKASDSNHFSSILASIEDIDKPVKPRDLISALSHRATSNKYDIDHPLSSSLS